MYQLIYDIRLEKVLKYIPKKDIQKIKDFLESLDGVENPYIHAKKIQGYETLYRYRVGNYRIIVNIYEDKLEVLVIDINHRKDVYKKY